MPSFDVVSEADDHEVQNAYDQAVRELNNRYDFQGTGVSCEKTPGGFRIVANSEDRVIAAMSVLEDKWVMHHFFHGTGIPIPRTRGIYHPQFGRTIEGSRLTNASEVGAAFEPGRYVWKPRGGSQGRSVSRR